MAQIWLNNDSQLASKQLKCDSKMAQKWLKNDSKNDLKMTQKQLDKWLLYGLKWLKMAENDLKMALKWI